MSQNLLSLQFSNDQLAAIDSALATLESTFAGLIALTPDQRRAMTKMGPKSEAFCRQTLNVLNQNPQVIPPSVNLAEAQADLAAVPSALSAHHRAVHGPRFFRCKPLFLIGTGFASADKNIEFFVKTTLSRRYRRDFQSRTHAERGQSLPSSLS